MVCGNCCGYPEDIDKGYTRKRGCTDFPCLIVFALYWVGFAAVAYVGFTNGDPYRLLYGTDYLGNICGQGAAPDGFSVPDGAKFQSQTWAKNANVFYPVPANFSQIMKDVTNFDPLHILDTGICVETCPSLPTETSQVLADASFDFTSMKPDFLAGLKVHTYGTTTVQGFTVAPPPYRLALYTSEPFYHRCLPNGAGNNESIMDVAKSIPGGTATTGFFFRGFVEVQGCVVIIAICGLLSLVLSFVYIFLMRCFLRVLTYIVMLLVAVGFVAAAGFCYYQSDKLKKKNTTDPKDESMTKYENAWFAGIFVCAFLLLCYIALLFFTWKFIMEAVGLIEVASRVLAASPFQILVSPVVGVLIVGVGLWCAFVGVWIFTSDKLELDNATQILEALPDVPIVDLDASKVIYEVKNGIAFMNSSGTLTNKQLSRDALLGYDLFGFLWSMGLINAVGFMILAFHSIFWYFSSKKDDEKEIETGSMCRAIGWSFIHIGTLAVGSFLIALIQFIRIVMHYIAKKCKAFENPAMKYAYAIAQCCLACFERVIRIISKNAYIMCGLTSQWFLCAAKKAVEILLGNIVSATIVLILSEMVCFVGKLLIVLICMVAGFLLMDINQLVFFDVKVETKILPLFFIGFIAFFVTMIFFNLFSTAVDSLFICFHFDRSVNHSGVYYAPENLANTIENYDHEEAIKKHESQQATKNESAEAVEGK